MTTPSHEGALDIPRATDGRHLETRPAPARVLALLFAGLLVFLVPRLLQAAPWVVITEIHYHPPGDSDLEFVEILNREPPRLDLTDWRLEGEVEFVFPQDETLIPGERLIVARDPDAFRSRYPRAGRVVGPYSGKLDNDGGRLTLRNPAGGVACEFRYGRDGRWPTPPDGSGHTLSLRSPYFDPQAPESWMSSPFIGGTPGAPNTAPPKRDLLIKEGDLWRYRRGRRPLPPDWHTLSFDDSDWRSGPSGFGYDDGDDRTEFPDMEDSYASVFVRKRFDLPDPTRLAELILSVDYDDGFVAYLNGEEVARANIGRRGEPVPHDAFANGQHEAGGAANFPLGTAGRLVKDGRLHAGTNVLAVQIHNIQISSSDLTLIVELVNHRTAADVIAANPPRLNEILHVPVDDPSGTSDFVEIFNPAPVAIDLGGHYLSDDPTDPRKLELPVSPLEPGGFAVFNLRDLGTRDSDKRWTPTGGDLCVTLTSPDGRRVLDALRLELADPEPEDPDDGTSRRGAISRGRYPDGATDIALLSRPSPGEANTVSVTSDIVINEIMYHPITESTDDEFIELYNRGGGTIPLRGFELGGGVSFRFADDDRIAADSYLVIAKNPEALRRKYDLPAPQVLGPFEKRLSNRGEGLTLKDPEGHVADRVEFADRAPWPRWADGLGSSIELVHPALDNALGASWAASDDRSKAEWQTLSYTKRHRYVMSGLQQEFQMMLLADGECFVDDLSLGAPRNLLPEGDFSRPGGWVGVGTHERSRTVSRGPDGETEYYHLISEGRGNPRNNYTALPVRRRLSNRSYRVELRAKWQRGSPLLLTRLAGQSLARLHRLKVPSRLGSPGAWNTVYRAEPAPAVGTPEQRPVAPTTGEEVTLTVPITSVEKLASATVHFRHEADGAWRSARLEAESTPRTGRAAQLWSGAIPPLSEGRVEFYIEARDAGGRSATYPPEALDEGGSPDRVALYGVGLVPHAHLPTYTLLASDREWRALRSRPTLSNRMATGTLVFGDERIFHGVRFRPRGSPFTRRGERNWRIVFGADTLDGRRSLTIDAQPNRGLGERLTFWLIDALHAASSRQQFVYFSVHGTPGSIRDGDGEDGVYEDVEKIDGSFLERWFGTPDADSVAPAVPPDGLLHKVDDYWELTRHGDRRYQEAFFRFRSTDPEDYRWNFPPRAGSVSEENFDPLIELIRFLDPRRTGNREFVQRAHEVIAVDQWIRVLAARTLSGDWDTIGGTRGKNAFVYLSPVDGLWYLLPWDADLAWSRDYRRISSRKFRSISRLLERPLHERLFHGHLEYLALRKLDSGYFGRVLGDLAKRSGKDVRRYAGYAMSHREVVLRNSRRFSRSDFAVSDARRIEREDGPDLARVRGVAPVLVRRLLLDGIEGNVELEGRDGWTAGFPIGPDGGELEIEALDLGGFLVDASTVWIEARGDALPLADVQPAIDGKPGEASVRPAVARADRAAVEATSAIDEALPIRRREPRRFVATEPVAGAPGRPAVASTRSRAERRVTVRERSPRRSIRVTPRRPRRRNRSAPIAPVLIIGGLTALAVMIALRRRRPGNTRKPRRTVGSSWRFDEVSRSAPSSESPTSSRPSGSPPPASSSRSVAGTRSASPIPPPPVLGSRTPPPAPTAPRNAPSEAGSARSVAPPPPPSPIGGRVAPPPPVAPPAPSRPTGRDRLASPVASALRNLAGRDFDRADQALRFLWASGKNDIAALIAALVDRRSTPILELDMTDDDGLRLVAACGEPGVEVRDIAGLLLAKTIGEPPVDHPGQEDWVAHWQATLGRDPES